MYKVFINKINLFILLFIIFFISCSPDTKNQKIYIKNGFIDLSSRDFAQDGKVILKGEWKFAWNEDDESFKNPGYNDSLWKLHKIPRHWKKKNGISLGYAWYRLKIKVKPGKNLGIYIRDANTSYTFYCNGVKLLSNGIPGTTKKTTVTNRYPLIEKLPEADEYVFAWKVTNFHYAVGGIWVPPEIGIYDRLKRQQWLRDFYHSLLMGICIIIGLYYITLWFFLKKDKSSLFFGLFCFVIFIRLLTTEDFMERLFYPILLYGLRYKLEFLTMAVGAVIAARFIFFFFKEYAIKKPLIILEISAVVLTCIILFTNSVIFTMLLPVYHVYLILYCSWGIWCILKAALHRRVEAFIIFGGMLFLTLTVLQDILVTNQVISSTILLAPTGLIVLIFANSLVLSMRFSQAYKTAEHLSKNLKKEVEIKTKEITVQKLNLEKLHREKNTFFINLAHETKTPLTLLVNYLNSYLKHHRINDELKIIKQSVDKLCRDMVNFLDSEKLEKGIFKFNDTTIFNLSKLIKDKIPLFNEIAKNKKIRIKDKIQEDIIIKADVMAIDRIINNLIENAIKFTQEKGLIEVFLIAETGSIIFIVKDNGFGIPVEKQQNIFAPYYQISHEKGNKQGMGMGLYIVNKIVESLEGTIELKSEPQKGSEFIVKLKKEKLEKAGDIEVNITGTNPEHMYFIKNVDDSIYLKGRYDILLVEDNLELINFLKKELEQEYNIFCAENGRIALEKLGFKKLPDLIISDIMMDEMDGFKLLNEIYKEKKYQGIPFIFLTAKTSFEDKIKGLKSGAIDFISKPFKMDELLEKIKSIISFKENQKESNLKDMEIKILQFLNDNENEDEEIGNIGKLKKFNFSEREYQIIECLIDGKGNKEISAELDIALSTVKNHISNIYKKSGAQSRVEFINIIK